MTGSLEEVRQLAQWLSGTGIDLLELSGPGRLIRLRRNESGLHVAEPLAAEPSSSATLVRAGSVGVLLHAHPLREQPLVRVGDEVAAGQVLALLKIGLLLLPVQAPHAGILTRVFAADQTTVGWGEPLFELA